MYLEHKGNYKPLVNVNGGYNRILTSQFVQYD
jgi:hypothetical protein